MFFEFRQGCVFALNVGYSIDVREKRENYKRYYRLDIGGNYNGK